MFVESETGSSTLFWFPILLRWLRIPFGRRFCLPLFPPPEIYSPQIPLLKFEYKLTSNSKLGNSMNSFAKIERKFRNIIKSLLVCKEPVRTPGHEQADLNLIFSFNKEITDSFNYEMYMPVIPQEYVTIPN